MLTAPSRLSSDCRLLRLHDVLKILAVSRSTFYANVRRGTYPQPVRIGLRAVAWREREIVALADSGIGKPGLDGLQPDH